MLLKHKNAMLRAIEAKDSEILLNMMNDIEIEKNDCSIAFILSENALYEMGLNCIYCTALTYNSRSLNLQKRLGFKEEGVLRQRVFKNGDFQDLMSTSLLKSEFVEKLQGE